MNTFSLVKTIITHKLDNVETVITKCNYYDDYSRRPQQKEFQLSKANRKVYLFCFKNRTCVNLKFRGE